MEIKMRHSPDQIKNLIRELDRRLQKLKERKAVEGVSVEPSVLLEIENIEKEIDDLQAKLRKSQNTDMVDYDSLSTEEIQARAKAILELANARKTAMQIEIELEIKKAKAEWEASKYRAEALFTIKQAEFQAEADRYLQIVNSLQGSGLSEETIKEIIKNQGISQSNEKE
jgi:uncharacterized protein (DUF849 family)